MLYCELYRYSCPDTCTVCVYWVGSESRSECKFEVNEKLSLLGIASPAYADPYTQTSTVGLIPNKRSDVSEEMMAGWSRERNAVRLQKCGAYGARPEMRCAYRRALWRTAEAAMSA